MKAPMMAAALVAALTGSAVAEVPYDRNLERAVLGIVKQRIGDIRGTLDLDVRLFQPEQVDGMATGSVTSPSMARLASPAGAVDGMPGAGPPVSQVSSR